MVVQYLTPHRWSHQLRAHGNRVQMTPATFYALATRTANPAKVIERPPRMIESMHGNMIFWHRVTHVVEVGVQALRVECHSCLDVLGMLASDVIAKHYAEHDNADECR